LSEELKTENRIWR